MLQQDSLEKSLISKCIFKQFVFVRLASNQMYVVRQITKRILEEIVTIACIDVFL